jgi:16S rRNA (guanine527-N7)-methyltransferase
MPKEAPEVAETIFGDRLGLAVEYASLLETEGVIRGLIGPREAPRLWDRHLLNCAVVCELISEGATVLDVGSGAGLPGIVLAVARPDISVILVEPLARRTSFLESALTALGLEEQVTVVRGRAEELSGRLHAPVVTARAVAPLDRLGRWCLPLTSVGGRMLALKGASAEAEIDEHQELLRSLGGGQATIRLCGVGLIEPPTTVIEVVHERAVSQAGSRSGRSRPSSSSDGRRTGRERSSSRTRSGSDGRRTPPP